MRAYPLFAGCTPPADLGASCLPAAAAAAVGRPLLAAGGLMTGRAAWEASKIAWDRSSFGPLARCAFLLGAAAASFFYGV